MPGITDLGLTPRKVKKVAILGGGLMGSGIVTALIMSNYPVILKEVNKDFLKAGIDRVKGKHDIKHLLSWVHGSFFGVMEIFHLMIFFLIFLPANLQSRVKKGKMTDERFEKTLSLVKGVLDYESFRDVDVVIEASV